MAIAPGHVFGDLYRDVPYPGGIMNETFAGGWSLAVQPAGSSPQAAQGVAAGDEECIANQAEHAENPRYNPFVQAFEHLYDDELFRTRSPYEFADRIEVPTLLVEAWQDEQVGSRAANLPSASPRRSPWRLLASNGDHGEYYGDVGPAPSARLLRRARQGRASAAERLERRAARERAVGEGRRPGAALHHRPRRLPADRRRASSASSCAPAASSPSTQARGRRGRLDLATPTRPYAGTHNQIWSQPRRPPARPRRSPAPPLDRRPRLARRPAASTSCSSSTAPDTDLEVLVSEVRPDGQEVYVQRGWLRASHRKLDPARTHRRRPYQTHRLEDVEPLTPGEPAADARRALPDRPPLPRGLALRIWVEAPPPSPACGASPPCRCRRTTRLPHRGPASSIAFPVVDLAGAPAARPSCADLRSQPCRPDPLAAAAARKARAKRLAARRAAAKRRAALARAPGQRRGEQVRERGDGAQGGRVDARLRGELERGVDDRGELERATRLEVLERRRLVVAQART